MNNNFDFDGWHLSLFNASHFEIFATSRFNFPESSEGFGEHAKICVSSAYRRGIVDSRQDNTCVATSPEYKMKRYHKKSKQTATDETLGKKISTFIFFFSSLLYLCKPSGNSSPCLK